MKQTIGAGVVLSALLLVGCTGAANVDGVTSPAAKPFFAIQPAGPGPDQAALDGRLVVRDGCVLLTAGSRRRFVLPVWPKGFTLARNDDGRSTVQDASGATVAVEGGQIFTVTGATKRHPHLTGGSDHQLQELARWLGVPVPEACIGGDVVAVWVVGKTQS